MASNESHSEAMQRILARAATDASFRAELLVDPRAAINRAFAIAIPVGFRLKFIERDPGVDALVVLPDLRPPDGELSDDALDAVSGGTQTDDPSNFIWSDPSPPPPPPPGGGNDGP
ncbi:MAG TPA: NHLP leader peptide family RiPP precursor [Gemmatimonadaceae bacterium]|nr:NHLP leader peptide family RiPP precursor [Gemmatimonadaceae bacterium]